MRMTSCAIKPNTAKGARNIAHLTMVIDTERSASRSCRKGSTLARSTCAAARPSRSARTTTASMSPCAIEAIGLVGNRPAMMSGPFISENGLPAVSLTPTVATAVPPPSTSARLSSDAEPTDKTICSPGFNQFASMTPVVAAATVVRTTKMAKRAPIDFNSTPDRAPVNPPTIDAKISGTSTIAINPRNICAGSASHLPRSSETAGGKMPMSGLSTTPAASPAIMPATTCAQRRLLTHARKRRRWR